MLKQFCVLASLMGMCAGFEPADWATLTTERPDERHVSSRGAIQKMLEEIRPACAFDPTMRAEDFPAWQSKLRRAMEALMKHPQGMQMQEPQLLQSAQRDGYRIEKWEAYPLPYTAVPFLVLIPDAATRQAQPTIFCIPGSGQPKEWLAGETSRDFSTPPVERADPNAMALHYVREGWVAVVVDNAGSGETGDAEEAAGRRGYDDENLARFLLEMDWSWLGYTSYVDHCILNWVKTRSYVDREHIVLSGFSLGTEPMMALGTLHPDIFAFVYNDFLCRTLERAQVMTRPSKNGARPAPNSIRHLIPGFWQQFDFPDIVAALAPRPVICTEGGLDRDFRLIEQAYRLSGAAENAFRYHHQPKYAHAQRWDGAALPHGLDRDTFFSLVNVDPRHHFFKKDLIIPWLREMFTKNRTLDQHDTKS